MKIRFLYIFLILMLFISCDCWQHTTGTVYEFGTTKPIDSVLIKTYTMDRLTREHYTDSLGHFETGTSNTGRCGPFLKVIFEKNGYLNQEINDPPEEIVVFMKK